MEITSEQVIALDQRLVTSLTMNEKAVVFSGMVLSKKLALEVSIGDANKRKFHSSGSDTVCIKKLN